jgi:hypothetical protein
LTAEPYKWHANDGEEVFVVLGARVEIRHRIDGLEKYKMLPSFFKLG